MNAMQSDIINITHKMPYYYLKDLLDYAIFLKEKSEKENDTEYLESIPGIVDSIISASKEELKDCTKLPGW